MEQEAIIISTGTLRPQDLLESYATTLEDYSRVDKNRALIHEARAVASWIAIPEIAELESVTERVHYILEDINDLLNELAPKGYWFGNSPDTPDEIGFWPIEDDE